MPEERAPEQPPTLQPWWEQPGESDPIVVNEAAADAAAPWRQDLVAALEHVRRELGAGIENARAEARSHSAALRAGIEEIEASLRQAVSEAALDVGGILREATGAVETSIESASRAMGDEHASTMDRFAKEFAIAIRPLGEGLARMERLASTIEAMGKRRGFQELVRSEQALREEQSGLVRTLAEAAADMSARVAALDERMRQLEERLEQAAQEAGLLRQVPAQATERVAGLVERLRGELSAGLQERFRDEVGISVERLRAELEAGLPVKDALDRLRDVGTTQSDLVAVQRSIDGVVASLREEVRGLHERIQGWGKPRTAPRLAREIDELGGRLDSLEEEIRGGLADRVAETVTERLLAGLEGQRRRGPFRRRRSPTADLSRPD